MISLKNLATNARELFPSDFFLDEAKVRSNNQAIDYNGNQYDANDIIDTNRASASLGGIPSTGGGTGTSGPIYATDVIETADRNFINSNTKNNLMGLEPKFAYLLALDGINTGNETKESIEAIMGGPLQTALEIAAAYIEKDPNTGKLPAKYWPSALDDVQVFANLAAFPVSGELGKFYLAQDTNKFYYWTGSVFSSLEAGVSSFNGRFGAVMPTANDYTTALVNPAGDRQYVTAQNKTDFAAVNWATLKAADLLTLSALTGAHIDSKLRDLSQVASASLAAKMIGYIPANDTYAVKTAQLGAAGGVATLGADGRHKESEMDFLDIKNRYWLWADEFFQSRIGWPFVLRNPNFNTSNVSSCSLNFLAQDGEQPFSQHYAYLYKAVYLTPSAKTSSLTLSSGISYQACDWFVHFNLCRPLELDERIRIGRQNLGIYLDSTGYGIYHISGSVLAKIPFVLSVNGCYAASCLNGRIRVKDLISGTVIFDSTPSVDIDFIGACFEIAFTRANGTNNAPLIALRRASYGVKNDMEKTALLELMS